MAEDILIVDDEDDIRLLISGVLGDEGYETRDASNAEQAIEQIAARRPSLVVLDIWLEDSSLDGMELLHLIRREHPNVPVVMISGHGSVETAVQAIKVGAYDYIEKPFKTDRLITIISRAIEAARLRRENRELRLRAGAETELVGDSPAVVQLRQGIDKVAPTGSRVLITGPAGAGKEVVARMLHACSRRADQPFVVVNCASMAPDRMEVELFGVESGRSNEVEGRKIGLFEQAHNGTLLLDEVGDMPLETQGKIVRVLQDQTFERVGGGQRIRVDVRVVATSTRDLQEKIQAGHFREDLFYRLNVVPFDVPNLTDRREDIPRLAEHFMRRASEQAGMPPRRIGPDAMTALQGHSWPGNVRQLRNVIEWLLIMASSDQGDSIRSEMLPPEILEKTPRALQGTSNTEFLALGLRDAREEFERQYLEAQVKRFGGNISKTATFVGMERSALHRKLKSLGVKGPGAGAEE
ncbi:MAG: sigma-54-dependent Fis family transcriptional regulator [Rhodospirillaceae bacterium]|nr:sigma-54-dependent Fis family transcriptional regulator [Rhodospirillaceae bacterium]